MNTNNDDDLHATIAAGRPFMLVPIVSRGAPGPDVLPAPGLEVISTHATAEKGNEARAAHATPAGVTVIDARAWLKGMHRYWRS